VGDAWESRRIADTWGIEWDQALEVKADALIGWKRPTSWQQDHRTQLAMLDSFFSAVEPGHSLVFLYAKDVPLLEERSPGARVLVGLPPAQGPRADGAWFSSRIACLRWQPDTAVNSFRIRLFSALAAS